MNENEESEGYADTPYLKNWLAFVTMVSSAIKECGKDKLPSKNYFIDKFARYVLSDRPDQYKYGLFPPLYHNLYALFDHLNVPLDEEETKAKQEFFDPEKGLNMQWHERRWGKDD